MEVWCDFHLCFWQLTRAYYAFLEVLFSSHIAFVLKLDTSTFMRIVGSLESGLKGLDISISSQVCQCCLAAQWKTCYFIYLLHYFLFMCILCYNRLMSLLLLYSSERDLCKSTAPAFFSGPMGGKDSCFLCMMSFNSLTFRIALFSVHLQLII